MSELANKARPQYRNLITVLGVFFALTIGAVGGVVWDRATTPPAQHDLDSRDLACVQVLRNGGIPDDCGRMYRLTVFP